MQIFWNDGCDGELWVDGEYLANTSSYTPPVLYSGLLPNTTYEVSFVVDGEVVAVETETTSDEDCDAGVESCESNGGDLGWIADGYCDSANNNADCLFDGGDCCPGDCVDEYYDCDYYAGTCADCIDPNSADNATDGLCDLSLIHI